jgi:hypothetical protein
MIVLIDAKPGLSWEDGCMMAAPFSQNLKGVGTCALNHAVAMNKPNEISSMVPR